MKQTSTIRRLWRHFRVLTAAFIVLSGTLAVVFGSLWAPPALAFFRSHRLAWYLELLLPFLPIFTILLGLMLMPRREPMVA